MDDIDFEKFIAECRERDTQAWRKWVTNPVTDEQWSFVHEVFPNVHVYSGVGMCPFQMEGLIGNWGFYFRERHERPKLVLFNPEKDYINSSELRYVSFLNYEISVNSDNVIHVLSELIPKLELQAPLWAVEVLNKQTGETSSSYARGWDSEEAIESWIEEDKKLISESLSYWEEYFYEIGAKEPFEKAKNFYNYVQNKDEIIQAAEMIGEPSLEVRKSFPKKPIIERLPNE